MSRHFTPPLKKYKISNLFRKSLEICGQKALKKVKFGFDKFRKFAKTEFGWKLELSGVFLLAFSQKGERTRQNIVFITASSF